MRTENSEIQIKQFNPIGKGYSDLVGKWYVVRLTEAAVSPICEYLHPDLTWRESMRDSDELVYIDTKEEAESLLFRYNDLQSKVKL